MDLNNIHYQELEILLEFLRICEKHGLKYYLAAGTLLGAVRHKGFIPWDHDIDVSMPRADYEKLYRICKTELDSRYFFQDYRTEPKFPYMFGKIRKLGTRVYEEGLKEIDMEQGIYIDVFPLDLCPDSDRIANIFFRGIVLFSCSVTARVNPAFVCGYTKWYMRFAFSVLKHFPNKLLFIMRETFRKAAGLFSCGKRICTVGGRHGFPKESFQSEWFDPPSKMFFEGIECSVPKDWNALLTSMYDDYMIPPPESQRGNHFVDKQ